MVGGSDNVDGWTVDKIVDRDGWLRVDVWTIVD